MKLSDRVEQLDGPCRVVDAEVLCALGTHVLEKRGRDRKAWWYLVGGADYDRLDPDGYRSQWNGVPAYTASLDAAMSLVPEGWTYVSLEVCAKGKPTQHCRASVERLVGPDEIDERVAGYAPTPALALCAAALRARGL